MPIHEQAHCKRYFCNGPVFFEARLILTTVGSAAIFLRLTSFLVSSAGGGRNAIGGAVGHPIAGAAGVGFIAGVCVGTVHAVFCHRHSPLFL